MNSFTRLCFRIGLACGALAVLGALVLTLPELGVGIPDSLRMLAERVVLIFGLGFMWLGFVLLIEAIIWLKTSWRELTLATKVVSVLGLLTSTFAGAYLFHWLFPSVLGGRGRA